MMNKKSKALMCLSVALALLATPASNAGPLDFAVKHPFISAFGAGASLYLLSDIHISRDLSYHPEKVEPYFSEHPEKFKSISKYVLGALEKPANKRDYDRYEKLAEAMGLSGIPSYVPVEREPEILVNPEQSPNLLGEIHENPIDQPISGSNIIYTPEGSSFDTSTEFPNETIATWEDYLFLKSQSQELADNMESAGMGKRPKGYAAHHLVSWNNGKNFKDCQKLIDLLNKNGIGLNDAINGTYLPQFIASKNDSEAYHPKIHTGRYYAELYEMLYRHDGDPEAIKDKLIVAAEKLKSNTFPY